MAFYDINGNPIDLGALSGVYPVFDTTNIYTCENPTGLFANFSEIYSAYDTLFNGLNVDKNLLGYGTNSSGGQDSSLPIYEYVIHNPLESTHAHALYTPPVVLLTSGIHGNEQTAVMGLYNFIKSVITDTEGVAKTLRNAVQWKIVPVCNPGGYNDNTRLNRHSVNINRNFSYLWSEKTDSDKGSAPYSEYETKALKTWADDNADGALFHIDFHNHVVANEVYFYIATNNVKHKHIFDVTLRGLYSHFLDEGVDLAEYPYNQELNNIPGISAEFNDILGLDSSIVETTHVANSNTYIKGTTELDGNFISELLRNYLWEVES